MKKFLRDRRGVVEWDGLNLRRTNFLTGCEGRDFGGVFGGVFFGVVLGVAARSGVWRGNDRNHFWCGVLVL